MNDEQHRVGEPTRRPDPTLGRLGSQPQLPPVRPEGRGAHRRRSERDEQPTEQDDSAAPARTRVVLADPKQRPSSMRPRVKLEQSSTWGTAMVDDLARRQLRAAVAIAMIVAVPLGVLPILYSLAPEFASLRVFGVPLAWLLTGVLPFPLLFGAGMWYSRIADYQENEFANTFDGS